MIPREWLKNQVSIKEVEIENMVHDRRLGTRPVPFGFIFDEWVQFKNKIRVGDMLWFFRSDQSSWNALAGREGYAIVRNNMIIDIFVTKMN